MAYCVSVHETPHCCSHFTSKEDHQEEEELQKQNKGNYSCIQTQMIQNEWIGAEDTHCSQQALRFLNGTVTPEEAHKHHHSPNSYQYVHTCEHRDNRNVLILHDNLKTSSWSCVLSTTRGQQCQSSVLFSDPNAVMHCLNVSPAFFVGWHDIIDILEKTTPRSRERERLAELTLFSCQARK